MIAPPRRSRRPRSGPLVVSAEKRWGRGVWVRAQPDMHASCHAVVVAKPWGQGFQPRACAWGGVLTKVKEGFDLLPQHLGLLVHGSRHGHVSSPHGSVGRTVPSDLLIFLHRSGKTGFLAHCWVVLFFLSDGNCSTTFTDKFPKRRSPLFELKSYVVVMHSGLQRL